VQGSEEGIMTISKEHCWCGYTEAFAKHPIKEKCERNNIKTSHQV